MTVNAPPDQALPAENGSEPPRVCCAAWLSDRALLVVWTALPSLASAAPRFGLGDAELAAVTHRFSGDGRPARFASLVSVAKGDVAGSPMTVALDHVVTALDADSLLPRMTELSTLLRQTLAPLAADDRARIMELLNTRSADAPDVGLSRGSLQVREALRERWPRCGSMKNAARGLCLEQVLRVDQRTFYVHGWACDTQAEIDAIIATTPEGARLDLGPLAFWFPRPDVDGVFSQTQAPRKSGFIALVTTPAASPLPDGWMVETHNEHGDGLEAVGPAVVDDLHAVRTRILEHTRHERLPQEALMKTHVHAALDVLQKRLAGGAAIDAVVSYGPPVTSPHVSFIVPLFGRIDLLEHQLAQFIHDEQIRDVQLLYLLDSPALGDELREKAPGLFDLYGVPFEVAVLRQNAGFAAAVNLGVSIARSPQVLLMHSDVMPRAPGWLGVMQQFNRQAGAGAVGARLLYHDDSLQHAGLGLARSNDMGLWQRQELCKGLHREIESSASARGVPAVSAACMLIERDRFRAVGGLYGGYVDSDYEDVDLCLRLAEAGLTNWYVPQAELYHLEGQSRPASARQLAAAYNTWLFNQRWGARLGGKSG
jgi:GT2 family glycosyltransferase